MTEGEFFKLDRLELLEPDLYDTIMLKDPFYNSTLNVMVDSVTRYAKHNKKNKLNILECGSGTGNLTIQLAKIEDVDNNIVGIDKDKKVFIVLKKKIQPFKLIKVKKYNVIKYIHNISVDVVAMSFLYHEIKDANKAGFIGNMYTYINKGGMIVIGDKFIPEYSSEMERDDAARNFYDYRIKVYKQILTENMTYKGSTAPIGDFIEKSELIAQGEWLKRKGDWKTSVAYLENLLTTIGFSNVKTHTVFPENMRERKVRLGNIEYDIDPELMGFKVFTAIKPK